MFSLATYPLNRDIYVSRDFLLVETLQKLCKNSRAFFNILN